MAMKRWIGAFVAAVFLSTATFHVLAHSDPTDSSCVVCHIQEASLPAAPAPAIVAPLVVSAAVADVSAPAAVLRCVVASGARAPPTVRA